MGSTTLSIDEKMTVKRVRAFFTDDLPKLQLLAHVRLSSVNLDAMPVHRSNENTAVDKMTRQVQARMCLDDMVEALSALPDMERKVIILKYIEGLQWFVISDRLHLSVRRLQEVMQQALNDFGIAYAETLNLIDEGE
ncbi:ArpU family phage packaging/lysis transcriptional regulator [Weissella cibaria]|uniref:ArpU family phage packaging/lysis transcriptional regulator n=1 Tax=Weissella cibaria TaxID=137591 RepID=UPI0022E2F2B7|nr:ArpU family phage packaging/lysis transcriptional regulator [Weissella cibaria]